ncbi:hypothetical protein V8E36_001686 [Tilletia maclaganii]
MLAGHQSAPSQEPRRPPFSGPCCPRPSTLAATSRARKSATSATSTDRSTDHDSTGGSTVRTLDQYDQCWEHQRLRSRDAHTLGTGLDNHQHQVSSGWQPQAAIIAAAMLAQALHREAPRHVPAPPTRQHSLAGHAIATCPPDEQDGPTKTRAPGNTATVAATLQIHLRTRWRPTAVRCKIQSSLVINRPSPQFMSLNWNLSLVGLFFDGVIVLAARCTSVSGSMKMISTETRTRCRTPTQFRLRHLRTPARSFLQTQIYLTQPRAQLYPPLAMGGAASLPADPIGPRLSAVHLFSPPIPTTPATRRLPSLTFESSVGDEHKYKFLRT